MLYARILWDVGLKMQYHYESLLTTFEENLIGPEEKIVCGLKTNYHKQILPR